MAPTAVAAVLLVSLAAAFFFLVLGHEGGSAS
jgi:hypothetical protein